MLLRGDPDAINSGFFIVARSLNVRSPLLVGQAQWQWRSTREGRARKGRGERSLSGEKGMLRRAAARSRAPPRPPLGDMKDEHVKDAAQGAAEDVVEDDVPQDVAQDLAFGARAARALITTPPPPPPPSWCSSR